MKIPKLLVLGTLVMALCMVGSAFGAACTSELSDSASPNGADYSINQTINYVLCVGVPADDPPDFYCTLTNVDVYFYPPGQQPTGSDACDDPGSDPNAVFIAHLDELAPGDAFCYDGTDNSALDYLITEAGCDVNTPVIAYMAVTFELEGQPDCDRKTIVNQVLPVDAPVCDVNGPTVVCEGDSDIEYNTSAIADTYLWSVLGAGTINGSATGTSVLVSPTSAAGFTVQLTVCNDNGDGGCCSDCNLPVTVTEAPDCLINGPDSICDSATEVEFCSDVNDAGSYYWEIIAGDAVIVGDSNQPCVLVDPNGPNDFTLKLSICNADPLCCDSCTKTVDVVPTPDCLIDGPSTVCEDSNNVYCSNAEADLYLWEVTGDAVIVGPNDTNCVTVHAGATGVFTLTLELCNELGIVAVQDQLAGCCNTCELEVTVEGCGVFCTFTQGFYGGKGKGCDGTKVLDLIAALLVQDGPVVVGQPGHSISLGTAVCINNLMPAGGTPDVLPAGDFTCATIPASLLKKGRFNNVLIGQVVALTLNLRLYEYGCNEEGGDLAAWVLPAEFCTLGEDGCPEHFDIPEDLVGLTVQELLDAANAALAGDTTYSLGDINDAVTAINEGFDECRETISCPTEEVCDNGCDDDFNGDVDCDDVECTLDLSCI